MHIDFEVTEQDQSYTLHVSGEVDVYTSPKLRDALFLLIEQGKQEINLDLAGLEYIDSTGIRVVIGALKKVDEQQGKLRILHAKQHIYRLFQLTGLTEIMEINVEGETL